LKYKNNLFLDIYSNKPFYTNYWIYNFSVTKVLVPKSLTSFVKVHTSPSKNKNSIINLITLKDKEYIFNFFNIFFLKKEKVYTKLKYSRSPQYDIVSGGLAAFLAGFFGFLISEKFGFELVDSGDFYFLFIYIVFLCIFLRVFLRLINIENKEWFILSLNWLFDYYKTILILTYNKLKLIFNL
jgi:hypothetical protein